MNDIAGMEAVNHSTGWLIDLKLLQVCQFMYVGVNKVLTMPVNCFVGKTNSVMFLLITLFL